MIKQVLYFGNPAYLNTLNKQLHIHLPNSSGDKKRVRPIEDIGMILLDNPQITITHNCIKALQEVKAVIISCDDQHMPHSIMLPLVGHSEQSERYRIQQEGTMPLKKNLWQQTIKAKIRNQIIVLQKCNKPSKRLEVLLRRVQSGDPANIEGQAAAYYWSCLFDDFKRDRYGEEPNNLLNFGYAILRSMIARALISSGLNLTLGIHHRNKYNPYCLADDIMEPFRPFVDLIAYNLYENDNLESFLSKHSKQALLTLAQMDAFFGKKKSPLMVGMSTTTSSLFQCYAGKKRKIIFPLLI